MLFEKQFPDIKNETIIKRGSASSLLQAMELAAYVCGFPNPLEVNWFYARVWHSPKKCFTKMTTATRVLLAIELTNGKVVKLAVEDIIGGRQSMYAVTFQDVKTGKSLSCITFWHHPGESPATRLDYEPAIEEIQKQVKWLQAQKSVK